MSLVRLCIIDEEGFYIKSTWGNHPGIETEPLGNGQEYVVSSTPREFNKSKWIHGVGWVETDFETTSPADRREAKRRKENRLKEIDDLTVPFIRRNMIGKLSRKDVDELEKLETEAEILRGELAEDETV